MSVRRRTDSEHFAQALERQGLVAFLANPCDSLPPLAGPYTYPSAPPMRRLLRRFAVPCHLSFRRIPAY
jgi:hypothetical protein